MGVNLYNDFKISIIKLIYVKSKINMLVFCLQSDMLKMVVKEEIVDYGQHVD